MAPETGRQSHRSRERRRAGEYGSPRAVQLARSTPISVASLPWRTPRCRRRRAAQRAQRRSTSTGDDDGSKDVRRYAAITRGRRRCHKFG
ncbi:unnamed protein product [Trichogramma brassicae]|uniref:Uncharacterized protein n=1 Tax=Trichogramma brassicae TaxID=86971 RepID=A0A6H5J4I8_9HYME|nr:unnamed protein product [Trichogramma brassicae]